MSRLLSLNVGLPRDVTWDGKTVRTAIWKSPVKGRQVVRKLNVDGDAQADLAGHGGENRAVFVYQIEAYRYWEKFLGRNDFTAGQFGENFTVEGLSDDKVCIGDRYQIGEAVFEVSQPRVTCYRLGIRMNEPRMPALVVAHHRPGFYLRVLQEGAVGSGDEIVKIADGPERMTVAEADALLYLPGHSREQLQRAVRIPALSKGWQSSFQTMLEATTVTGNAGLATEVQAPAWPGFRQMIVVSVCRESIAVNSFTLVPADGNALSPFLPGQFIALRLAVDPDKPAIVRSYSLSDASDTNHYRISVKSEASGIGSSFLCSHVREGDLLDVSAPRGSFTLLPGSEPVVLVSAGIGATPVMAMLHALAAEKSKRGVWWVYGTRDGANHPFAQESRSLIKRLPAGRSYVMYSRPGAADKLQVDYDGVGHIDLQLLKTIGIPQSCHFYLCGPASFLEDMRNELRDWGVNAANVHTENFGAIEGSTPGLARIDRAPHQPEGRAGPGPSVSFVRSGLTVEWDSKYQSLLELAEACDVPTRWSCRTGVCHTCMTGLVGGVVRYNPEPLETPSDGNVLVCCSQPDADVVLDL